MFCVNFPFLVLAYQFITEVYGLSCIYRLSHLLFGYCSQKTVSVELIILHLITLSLIVCGQKWLCRDVHISLLWLFNIQIPGMSYLDLCLKLTNSKTFLC